MKRRNILILIAIAILLTLLVLFRIFRPLDSFKSQELILIEYADTTIGMPETETRYGFPVDSFIIVENRVSRNQTLSLILQEFDISLRSIDRIAKNSEDIFDLTRIKSGNKYTMFFNNDSLYTPKYLVYEESPSDYVIFHLTEPFKVVPGTRKVTRLIRNVAGTVTSSLWYSMKDQGINPMLAVNLSEIFAWTIDFFRLQEGDRFKAIYDELFVDSLSIGLGKVHAAWFLHEGREYYAIPFTQGGKPSFFDMEGNSLHRTFLKAPLRFSRISSRYSYSRLHPILKIRRPHYGVDYAAPLGTPVLAIGDGKVTETSYKRGNGNMVKIRHNSVYSTAYLHLSHFGKGIRPGSYVRQGEVVGYVGNTGLSTGPHLDFRFYKNGHPVDPLKVEAPPVEPISRENIDEYNTVKQMWKEKLDTIRFY